MNNMIDMAAAALRQAKLDQVAWMLEGATEDKRVQAIRDAIGSVLNDMQTHYQDPGIFGADLAALNKLASAWSEAIGAAPFSQAVLSYDQKLASAAEALARAGHPNHVTDSTTAGIALRAIGTRLDFSNREQFLKDIDALKALTLVLKHPHRTPVLTTPAKLPSMRCDSSCTKCCGVVAVSEEDLQRVLKYARDNGIKPVEQGLYCPFFQSGRCAVHPVRPRICQAFGHHTSLCCPRGYNVNMDVDSRGKLDETGKNNFFRFLNGGGPATRLLHEALFDQEPEGEVSA